MNSKEIEKYKKQLDFIEKQLTDKIIEKMSKKELEEYIILVSKIKARINLLEKL